MGAAMSFHDCVDHEGPSREERGLPRRTGDDTGLEESCPDIA
jgi:hypothetical protein